MRDDMTITRPDSSFSKLIHVCHSARYRPIFARVPEHLHRLLRVVTGIPKHLGNWYWPAISEQNPYNLASGVTPRLNDALLSAHVLPSVVCERLQASSPSSVEPSRMMPGWTRMRGHAKHAGLSLVWFPSSEPNFAVRRAIDRRDTGETA
jgi:hypothetical protein